MDTEKQKKVRKLKKTVVRQKKKKIEKMDIKKQIENYFKSEKPVAPHPIHVLSCKDWIRHRKNSIVLLNLVYERKNNIPLVYYKDMIVGENIVINKKKDKFFINLGGISGCHSFILAKVNDLEKYGTDTFLSNLNIHQNMLFWHLVF